MHFNQVQNSQQRAVFSYSVPFNISEMIFPVTWLVQKCSIPNKSLGWY